MKGQVKRFEKGIIVTHWVYAVAFLALLFTGIGFEYRTFSFLMGPTARLIHRLGAVVLFITPASYFLVNPLVSLKNLKQVFSWSMDDTMWIIKAPGHYMLGKGDMPPAGMYNAGQKLNYMIVLLSGTTFVISGAIMWFLRTPELVLAQRDLFRWSVIAHTIAFYAGVTMFALHFYLSLIHPFTKQAITAMLTGYVSRNYAQLHHPKWLAQVDEARHTTAD